jgi:hypothetical protein
VILLSSLQSFFKKKKEKEKLPHSAQSFNLFCQIVIFFHKHMKNKNVVLKQFCQASCIGEDVGFATSLGERRVNQVFFEGTFFNQVAQGRTELGGTHLTREKFPKVPLGPLLWWKLPK